jgi:hypothetical protein
MRTRMSGGVGAGRAILPATRFGACRWGIIARLTSVAGDDHQGRAFL